MRAMRSGRGVGLSTLDFASTPRLAFAVPPAAGADAHDRRLGNMKTAARFDPDPGGRELVPAAKLRERNAKAVRDGDQGIAAARCVVNRMRRGRSRGRYRHDKGFDTV